MSARGRVASCSSLMCSTQHGSSCRRRFLKYCRGPAMIALRCCPGDPDAGWTAGWAAIRRHWQASARPCRSDRHRTIPRHRTRLIRQYFNLFHGAEPWDSGRHDRAAIVLTLRRPAACAAQSTISEPALSTQGRGLSPCVQVPTGEACDDHGLDNILRRRRCCSPTLGI